MVKKFLIVVIAAGCMMLTGCVRYKVATVYSDNGDVIAEYRGKIRVKTGDEQHVYLNVNGEKIFINNATMIAQEVENEEG